MLTRKHHDVKAVSHLQAELNVNVSSLSNFVESVGSETILQLPIEMTRALKSSEQHSSLKWS